MNSILRKWRKYGGLIILISMIISYLFLNLFTTGILTLLMLSVPCTNNAINQNKTYWIFRQSLFLIIGVLLIGKYFINNVTFYR